MVTETIYRKKLRPVVEGGAEVMDLIFPAVTACRVTVTQMTNRDGPRSTFVLVGATGFEPVALACKQSLQRGWRMLEMARHAI